MLTRIYGTCFKTDAEVEEQSNVEEQIKLAEEMLKQETEPAIDISANCHTPYKCGFWKYCSKHLPTPSVFDLYRTNFDKKIDYCPMFCKQ